MHSRRTATGLLSAAVMAAILLGLVPAVRFPGAAAAAATWRVDDSGGADFTTIQAAVDAAAEGDTIIVRDGTYIENLVINKDRLTVVSENGAGKTLVEAADPGQDIVHIEGQYDHAVAATIDGFTITGAMSDFCSAVDVEWDADGSRVANNIIDTGGSGTYSWGVEVTNSEGVTINGNTIVGEWAVGLTFAERAAMTGNTILGGQVSADGDSVVLTGNTLDRCLVHFGGADSQFSGNAVSGEDSSVGGGGGSTILDSTFTGGSGLSLGGGGNVVRNIVFTGCGLSVRSSGNSVDGCTVNGKPLLYLEDAAGVTIDSADVGDVGQIVLVQCRDTAVTNFTIADTGAGVQLYESWRCRIVGNMVEGCGSGIQLWESSRNTLRLNRCEGNGAGIELYTRSDDNLLWGNTLSGNTLSACLYSSSRNRVQSNLVAGGSVGIVLSSNIVVIENGHESYVPSENNTIRRNDVVDSTCGIAAGATAGNLIYNNNFASLPGGTNARDNGEGNLWDNGPLDGGNWWSDHDCEGNPSDGSQSYPIEGDAAATDRYPFQDRDGWPPDWDINRDRKVDYKDLAILGAHYGETTSAPYPAWDVNQDDIANYRDLAILGAHYGETY